MTSDTKKSDWLDIVETLSVVGSIGGSIASVIFQQVGFASIPLSLSVALSLANRRRLLDTISQDNHSAITQLTQDNIEAQTKLETLTEQLAGVQQQTTDLNQSISNLPITQLMQESAETQDKFGTLTQQLAELQQQTTDLGQSISTQLLSEQKKITDTVGYLQEIETCTQTIRISPDNAKVYYRRGSIYQSLGYKEAAIWDHTQAIRINPNYAEAYRDRGLTRADLGDRKGAVRDLREATKLFFEAGDIANYQIAKDFSQKFHELSSQPSTDAPEEVALESLFA